MRFVCFSMIFFTFLTKINQNIEKAKKTIEKQMKTSKTLQKPLKTQKKQRLQHKTLKKH
jgi:hypothetical protein